MPPSTTHQEAVDAWRASWAGTLAPSAVLELFERALDTLWRRAHMSLGEITLMAIVDRVIHQGTEKFPHLAALSVETSGLHFAELRQAMRNLDGTLLDNSLTFLLVELLRVLGVLTGEVLTPALHAELRKLQGRAGADTEGKA